MIEHWREFLYPIGFLSSLAFGGRFLLQWLTSEMKKESVVPRAFWQLSLIGNIFLLLHSIIQAQFHVALVQSCNGIISWRNLNLMQPAQSQTSFKKVCLLLAASIGMTTLIFAFQGYFLSTVQSEWFRIPIWQWQRNDIESVPLVWHVVGFVGLVLFNSRFWIQWWNAEKTKSSHLGASFWWMSLIGDLVCLIYFSRITDAVNVVGPAIGLVPYVRNLMLLRKSRKSAISRSSS